MAEIPNVPSHSLVPGDFFVVVKDPEGQCTWEYEDKGKTHVASISKSDLEVNRVDGDLVRVMYVKYSPFSNVLRICSKTLDMSKIDYKRISRESYHTQIERQNRG